MQSKYLNINQSNQNIPKLSQISYADLRKKKFPELSDAAYFTVSEFWFWNLECEQLREKYIEIGTFKVEY